MEGAALMSRINQSGVKKICRNIFTLQQALTNITMNREPALDQVSVFLVFFIYIVKIKIYLITIFDHHIP